MKKVGFLSRLFNTEAAQAAASETVKLDVQANLDRYAAEAVEKAFGEYQNKLAEAEAAARIVADAENTKRIQARLDSSEPWFEAKDMDGDMSDVANYRWNVAFINKFKIEHGLSDLTPKEIFAKYIEHRDYNRRLDIIREEKDRLLNDPTPWFEWTLKGDATDDGYPVHMEWNHAFIRHIREQGFVGRNEDELVRLWLSRMVRHTPSNGPNDYD